MNVSKPTDAKTGAALKANFLNKLLEHGSTIEQAAAKNPQNSNLQVLNQWQQSASSLSASQIMLTDAQINQLLAIMDEAVRSAAPTPKAAPTVKPTASPSSSESSSDNVLGIDLDDALGDALSDPSFFENSQQQNDRFSVDGDKIVMKIDEELEQGIDEEAKMMQADLAFRGEKYYEALIPALELNIRFKQGIGKRQDVIVKRQDEIIFVSNYKVALTYLESAKTAKGDQQTEYKLRAIMHFYAALDQNALPNQEKDRDTIKLIIDKIITVDRGGQAYIKTGIFSKLSVPAPEDKATKSLYWEEQSKKEKDPTRKEFCLLMTFGSDLGYYKYQIELANFYVQNGKVSEGCRYIKVPLPVIEDEGMAFLNLVRTKDAAFADKFIERRFASDIKLLDARLLPDEEELNDKLPDRRAQAEEKRFSKAVETVVLWQQRMDLMKQDLPFRNSTLRSEYIKAFSGFLERLEAKRPNTTVNQTLAKYAITNLRNAQNPVVVQFIDFHFRYAIQPDAKNLEGLSVEGESENKFLDLCNVMLDHFDAENGDGRKNINETKKAVVTATDALMKAMQQQGYKFVKTPKLVKS
jgi:hypothetical protein